MATALTRSTTSANCRLAAVAEQGAGSWGEDRQCVGRGIVVVEGRHQHDTGKLACDRNVRWGYCADCGGRAEVGDLVYRLYGLTDEEIAIVEGQS